MSSRNVNVPDNAVVIVLTPRQAELLSGWLESVTDHGNYGYIKPLPKEIAGKLHQAIGYCPKAIGQKEVKQ